MRVCSVHEAAESIASQVLASFPLDSATKISLSPNIRKKFRTRNLVHAVLDFDRYSPRMKSPPAERQDILRVQTEWHWPIAPKSKVCICLRVHTEEYDASIVHAQAPKLLTRSLPSKLSSIHPTFGLHEAVARHAEEYYSDISESTLLLLAQCTFHLADVQSPCKRLREVHMPMKEIYALVDTSTSARDQSIEAERKVYVDRFASCRLNLTRKQYEGFRHSLLPSGDIQTGRHRAFVALGGNIGNRIKLIELAVREMSDRGLTVLRTSALYETKPMYLENQEPFINGACEVSTFDASCR